MMIRQSNVLIINADLIWLHSSSDLSLLNLNLKKEKKSSEKKCLTVAIGDIILESRMNAGGRGRERGESNVPNGFSSHGVMYHTECINPMNVANLLD